LPAEPGGWQDEGIPGSKRRGLEIKTTYGQWLSSLITDKDKPWASDLFSQWNENNVFSDLKLGF